MKLNPEVRVLRNIDKLVHTDPDYWPTFQLRNVRILPQGKASSKYARSVSLLEASASKPVCVLGELGQVDDDYIDRVFDEYQETHDGLTIVIPTVTNFCYGEQDRICKLWAEGEAGWFEIQPAKDYQQIYHQMTEAVTEWYFLEDQHNIRGTRKARNPDVDTLLEVYLKKHRKHGNVENVQDYFHMNQYFLISQMKKQDAEIGDVDDTRLKWADTNIYAYFVGHDQDWTDEGDTPQASTSSSSSEEVEEEVPTTPLPKRLKAGKSAKSAGLRPAGLTPKPATHKSVRSRAGLSMQMDSDDESTPDGDVKRMTMVNEMKKAGARTSFLEAFLEGRNGET